jgi:hypothetical protein
MNVTVKLAWRHCSGSTVCNTQTVWMERHQYWFYLQNLTSTICVSSCNILYRIKHTIHLVEFYSSWLKRFFGLTYNTKKFAEVLTPRLKGVGKSKLNSTNNPLVTGEQTQSTLHTENALTFVSQVVIYDVGTASRRHSRYWTACRMFGSTLLCVVQWWQRPDPPSRQSCRLWKEDEYEEKACGQ